MRLETVSQTTDFGNWYVYPEYSVYWWQTVNGTDVPGGTYTITKVGGGFSLTVTNNDVNDMNKNTWFYVNVPGTGFYDVCQTVAPTGAKLAVPSCKQVEVEELGLPGFGLPFESLPL